MFEKIKEFFRRNKFKKGDKVYVIKNVCGKNYITLNPNGFFYYHYKHFKKYEQV